MHRPYIDMAFCRDGAFTRPRRCLAVPPLQLSRVRYENAARPGQATLTLLHLGGILAGDNYRVQIELEPGADAQIVGAAATQVYRMPAGEATQTLDIRLEANSRLIWTPEPLILFAGARFHQSTRITLAPGASLTLLDIFTPGRLARGECFQFDRYTSKLDMRDQDGKLLAAEQIRLEPHRHNALKSGFFGSTPVLGSLFFLGDNVDAEGISRTIAAYREPHLAAAILPGACGVLVRMLGATPSEVRRRLLDLLSAFEVL
jgi:urease accessory protein